MGQDDADAVTVSTGERKATILVVDDDPVVQSTLVRLLRLRGFNALQASTVSEVIRIAEHTVVNAFILDINLAETESGLDVLAWLRRRRQYSMTPVLILTGMLDVPADQRTLMRQHRAHLFYKGQSLQLLIDYLTRSRRPLATLPQQCNQVSDPTGSLAL